MSLFNDERKRMKKAVLTYGRMNPPHIGHERLIRSIFEIEGDHFIVVSHTQDNKKNPLTIHEKIQCLHKMFPEHKNNFYPASKLWPTIFQFAERLYEEGYTHLHIVLGEDRLEKFQTSLQDYNGRFNAEGKGYSFESLTFSSPGQRKEIGSDEEIASSTKMKEFITNGDIKGFKRFLPLALQDDAEVLMNKVSSSLKKTGS